MKLSIQTFIWAFILVAIAVAAVLAFMPRPVDVEIAKAVSGTLKVTVQEDGTTRIREKYVVSAPVSGQLARIELREGDLIGSLDTLLAVILPSEPAMLDARSQAEARARVQAAEAALQRAKTAAEQAVADFELKQTKLDRARELRESNSIPEAEFDIARTDLLISEQAVQAAEFGVEIAKFELQMAQAAVNRFADSRETEVQPFQIFAPVTGAVLKVFQKSATAVSVGTPLIEIGDPQNLEMEIDVLSTDAVKIQPGAELVVQHWGGKQPLHGHVRVVEPAAFTKISSLGVEEQRVNVIADFDEPPERLKSLGDGYRIEAEITIDDLDDVVQVPNSALFRYQRNWHVFRVSDGRAVKTAVSVGVQNETHAQITDGISAGDEIIVYPGDQLNDGTLVRQAE